MATTQTRRHPGAGGQPAQADRPVRDVAEGAERAGADLGREAARARALGPPDRQEGVEGRSTGSTAGRAGCTSATPATIGLADARRLAARVMLDVAEGKDPAAERQGGAR